VLDLKKDKTELG